jgi:hypothetical protein
MIMSISTPTATAAVDISGLHIGPACRDKLAPVLCAIKEQHRRTNVWRVRAGNVKATLSRKVYEYPARRPYYLWVWRHKRIAARTFYKGIWSWYYGSGASCVHGKEGSWSDPNPLYYGGFQMDMSFQSSFGSRYLARYGTANHWPATIQIRVTRSVVKQAGWGRWPNTARACGLL